MLTVFAVVALLAVALWPPPLPASSATTPAGGDADLYAAIVVRLQAGQAYYAAAHAEMVRQGYGTASVFNWRTPLYPHLLAWLGPSGAQIGLTVLAVIAGGICVAWVGRSSGRNAGLALIPLVVLSLAATFAPGTVYFAEIAAGVLILLSVGAYGLGNWPVGLLAGLAALFVRELAAPYIIVAVLMALQARRKGEMVMWAAGLIAYAIYFVWHVTAVLAQLGPADRAYAEGWLQFGGFGFILRTAQVDGVLFALPLWVAALVLPFAVLGLAARRDPRAALTVGLYLMVYACIGKPFDNYWGALYTPLLALGLVTLPAALRDLWTAVHEAQPAVTSSAASVRCGCRTDR